MATRRLRSLAKIPLFLITRPMPALPQNLLNLPDELLELITNMLPFEDRVAASLTCRKLNNLIPPLDQDDGRRLTDPTHPRFIPGPLAICRNTKIKRLFDRPDDTCCPRWCLICYRYRPGATFPAAGDMVCHLHNGADRLFATNELPQFLSPDLYDVVAQLKRTHTDAHYIELIVGYNVHCRTWEECVHCEGLLKFDPEHAGHCPECGMIDVKVYVTPDPASYGPQPLQHRTGTTSRISHGGYMHDCAEDAWDQKKREFIGIPGVGMLDRRGRKWMPVYEAQSWETANGKKSVLVLRREKMDANSKASEDEDPREDREEDWNEVEQKDGENLDHDEGWVRRALSALIGLKM